MKKKDNPGVYLPPPLIYVFVFLFSLWVNKMVPLREELTGKKYSLTMGILFILIAAMIIFAAIFRFIISGNTLVTIKPAKSLQAIGIYRVSRNPMYLGLVFLYTGLAFLKGNTWTILFIPLIIIFVQAFVIRKEEKYLLRTFGNEYENYRSKVRRWL
ncbi:MAG: isoprenylcysteine carboxylmethyltransferase family protein [Terrimonas sp.]|nr:isoprenylcysteine carboxylmethyltransferase family protein [Terrimonas sp.]